MKLRLIYIFFVFLVSRYIIFLVLKNEQLGLIEFSLLSVILTLLISSHNPLYAKKKRIQFSKKTSKMYIKRRFFSYNVILINKITHKIIKKKLKPLYYLFREKSANYSYANSLPYMHYRVLCIVNK